MKKAWSCILAVCMMVAMFASCTPSTNNNGGEKDVIVIGMLAPLTGEVALYGVAAANGAQLAVDEINANGGINGRQVQLIIVDEKGDVTEAVNGYEKLMEQGMDVLLGDVTSKPTLAVAELAAEDGIPMITPTGTAAAITDVGPNIFRTCFTDPFQGRTLAVFASDNLGATNVAVMYDTGSDYSAGVAAAFIEEAGVQGLNIVAEESYGESDVDFKTQLTKIINSGAEVIVLPDYYGKAALVAVQARALGFTGAIIGPDGFDGVIESVDANNMQVTNNMYYTNHFFDGDETPVVADFIANYEAAYGERPLSFAALGYDSVYIIKAAIEDAGEEYTDYAVLTEAMSNVSVEGVTGTITFDDEGNPIKSVSVIKIEDGQQTLAAKVSIE
jgi:ABC-type branched-chain amino acid transport systems, periplasmic component